MWSLLSPRLWIALALAGLLAFSHITAYRKGRANVRTQWDAAKVTQERASQEQAARNRELQRQAELKYVVKREAQDRFIAVTVKELTHASEPLAACPVPPDVVRLLNDANHCASGNPAPAGCSDGKVPSP
jgi:hypothetical protein